MRTVLTPEIRQQSAAARAMRVKIDQYLTGRVGPSPKRSEKVAALKLALLNGVVPVGRRSDGATRAMKPTERGDIAAEVIRLKNIGCVDRDDLRADVLRNLRDFAARESWSFAALRAAGFSDADLYEAGVTPPEHAQESPPRP
jgi:hypothetical protein